MKSFTLHGAQVYDPEENRFLTKDVFVSGGKICAEPEPDARTLDVSGCLLTTGLIDFHVHYFNHGTENGVNPDACSFPCGITTAVDAGSCGAGNVEAFLHGAAAQSDVTIYAQLLTASGGQTTDRYPEHAEVRYLEHERIRELFERYPETLKGLKLRLSRNVLVPEEARARRAAGQSRRRKEWPRRDRRIRAWRAGNAASGADAGLRSLRPYHEPGSAAQ